MQTLRLFNRLARCQRGNAAVELAVLLPFLLGFVALVIDAGMAFSHAQSLEKGMHAGALYAARSEWPVTQAVEDKAVNLVKTGSLDGTGAYTTPGFAEGLGTVTFTYSSKTVGEITVPVINVTVDVPRHSYLPGITEYLKLQSGNIRMHHEQLYLGQ